MPIPWWGWVLGIPAAIAMLLGMVLRSSRRRIRDEFIAYLAKQQPNWLVTVVDGRRLSINPVDQPAIAVDLHKLYVMAFKVEGQPRTAARIPVYETFRQALLQQLSDQVITLEKDGARLRPRIVPGGHAQRLAAGSALLSRELPGTGLSVLCVLDSPSSVTYVTEQHVKQLGIDADALHQRAMVNLAATIGRTAIDGVVLGKNMVAIKTGDTFDAARLLVIPALLADGEQIAALIPDRDILTLLPVPVDGDWSGLQQLARVADGQVLLDRPLLVTKAGFELR